MTSPKSQSMSWQYELSSQRERPGHSTVADIHDQMRHDPLSHLDYFTEWGKGAWARLVRSGIEGYLGGDLSGLNILGFGARYGRMSCLFALLGARVTGIDIHEGCLKKARAEARAFGVASQTEFIQYDGNLESFAQGAYDVVFSKSVLVLVKNMPAAVRGLRRLLRDKGRFVFIENGLGGPFLRLARRLKHRGKWDYSQVRFITPKEIELFRSEFNVEHIERSYIPPIYLFCGVKHRHDWAKSAGPIPIAAV